MSISSRRAFLAAAVAVPTTAFILSVTSGTASAAGYQWGRTLAQGDSGEDVSQLQIRVSGYPGYDSAIAIDGAFGPHTHAAVVGFQQAYGLAADGVFGPNSRATMDSLQSPDNTPIHFTYGEMNGCNSTWEGGKVGGATAMFNALICMWKLEAMRHALGDQPIVISSGFRDANCNAAAGGASDSRHMYGDAADLIGSHSFCTMASQARYHGFRQILGPGFPGHNDHTHVDSGSRHWSFPNCG
ncbi:D-Ala-D-Ala carboxypeptidase family metallohydrolase [Stackebrandtia soli]|uniref:D-Ala-D-Ala carboxypeptidase family metallohydrolase n=1 Tax=Stackebrandtia soli TaxID=1892856 RepID=UPI0039EB0E53